MELKKRRNRVENNIQWTNVGENRFQFKILQTALYIRKSTLGIRFIAQRIISDILKLKIHVGNNKKSDNAMDLIKRQEELQ